MKSWTPEGSLFLIYQGTQCLFYSTLALIIADNEQIMGWEISLFEVSEGRLYQSHSE